MRKLSCSIVKQFTLNELSTSLLKDNSEISLHILGISFTLLGCKQVLVFVLLDGNISNSESNTT